MLFHSRKHHYYGYKMNVSILPLDFAIYVSEYLPESAADVTILL